MGGVGLTIDVNWLLRDSGPAVEYRARTEMLGESPEQFAGLRESIWDSAEVKRMMRRQRADGQWSEEEYGVNTALRYLTAFAEMGLSRDPRLDRAVDGAAQMLKAQYSGEAPGDAHGCADALQLRALVMLGYHERADVRALIGDYAASQRFDGGFACERLARKRPGRKSCYKACVAALLLHAECTLKGVSLPGAGELAKYFMSRDVFYRSDREALVLEGRPGWRSIDSFFPPEPMRVGLEQIVAALAALGAAHHPAMERAWALLEGKIGSDGRVVLEGTLSRQPCSFGKVGAANGWLTLYAALAAARKMS
jgi:hypothetical protein